nr:undecaprenyl diphosphate synthase family protein [Jiangella alkaliphila]
MTDGDQMERVRELREAGRSPREIACLQSTQAELYFCDAYWPGFRQVDFLRALRTYAGSGGPR